MRASVLVLVQHNILWHTVSEDGNEVFEVNVDDCLARLRFGRYVQQAEELLGKAVRRNTPRELDVGQTDNVLGKGHCSDYTRPWQASSIGGARVSRPVRYERCDVLDLAKAVILTLFLAQSRYSQAMHNLVSSSYLKASTVLSHVSPRDKRIKYEAEEKAKITGFPTTKQLREAKELAEARIKRERDEAEKIGLVSETCHDRDEGDSITR